MRRSRIASAALFLGASVLFSSPHGVAQDKVTLYLNWAAGPEHAPLFYAQKAGLYARAGVQVAIEPGSGSGRTVGLVAKNPASMAIADLQVVLAMRSKGSDVVAVMNLFANSPYTFYWLKNSGIRSIRDFAGKKIGTEARDPARALWRALARINGIDPSSAIWVDVPNAGKVDALRDGTVDITINAFPDSFRLYPEAFGDNLGRLPWRDAGLNLYNISLIASSALIRDKPRLVAAVVRATQAAVAACLADGKPCIDALAEAYPNLKCSEELANWRWAVGLYQNAGQAGFALGAFDPSRVRKDFDIAREVQDLEADVDPASAIDNSFLDAALRPSSGEH